MLYAIPKAWTRRVQLDGEHVLSDEDKGSPATPRNYPLTGVRACPDGSRRAHRRERTLDPRAFDHADRLPTTRLPIAAAGRIRAAGEARGDVRGEGHQRVSVATTAANVVAVGGGDFEQDGAHGLRDEPRGGDAEGTPATASRPPRRRSAR